MSESEDITIYSHLSEIVQVISALKQLETRGSVTLVAFESSMAMALKCAENIKRLLTSINRSNFISGIPDTNKVKLIIKLGYVTQDSTDPEYKKPIGENGVQDKTFEEFKILACEIRNKLETESLNLTENANSLDIVNIERGRRPARRGLRGRCYCSRAEYSTNEENQMENPDRPFERFRRTRGRRGDFGISRRRWGRGRSLRSAPRISSCEADLCMPNWFLQGQEGGDPGDLIQRVIP